MFSCQSLSTIFLVFSLLIVRSLGEEVEIGRDNVLMNSKEASKPSPFPVPELLAWSPRAFLYPQFLTTSECEHLKRTAVNLPGWDNTSSFSNAYFSFRQEYEDSVLRDIESRIAILTGVSCGRLDSRCGRVFLFVPMA